MWTPRRILLLLLGIAGFSTAYIVYSQFLGAVDGLPALPTAFLEPEDGLQSFEIPEETYSPTLLRLQEAFGPGSPEVTDSIEYKTKLEIRDKGMVFACGQLMFAAEPSEYVTVSPFSVAFFGKPRPPGTRQPGEIAEINTFHADKAVLQFDRPVQNTQDLSGKARLVGMELVSTPDTPTLDPRRGRIEVINNQRSADTANHLVFRTPGPLYYRTANAPGPKPPPGSPQIWSEAAIEVVDRRNLPRPLRVQNLNAVPSRGDDLRGRNAVANILLGLTLPPPTITAEGIKIFLTEQDAQQGKRNASGYAGVERIELSERMQMNLWADGQSGLPGGPSDAPATPVVKLPEAAPGLIGGLADAAAIARMLESKTLLVVETLGPFVYDFKANTAVFEAAPAANPAVSNHVTVTRLSAKGGQDNLFCKRLEVVFNDAKDRPPSPATGPTSTVNSGMKIKQLLATGEHVFVSIEGEQLLAQGKELRYTVDANAGRSTTILKGAPVVAVRERNRMQGGDAQTPAEVYLTSFDPKPSSHERKRTDIEVRGPGRIEMFDAASNDNTLQATWGASLIHRKEITNGREQNLLTFNGGGTFLDTKGGMRLSADRLQLWLAETGEHHLISPSTATAKTPKVLPQRLVAVGNVDGQSAEAIIRKTDQLTVTFRDVPTPSHVIAATSDPATSTPQTPLQTPKPPAPAAVAKADTAPKPTATPPVSATPPEKAKPPIYISARLVDAFVMRYPLPDTGRKTNAKSEDAATGGPGLKYEMERARCEDRVMVHQDPADPRKSTRGTDIYGTKLLLDQSPAGGVLTVHGGTPTQPAQVYFEDMALFGPIVVLDQPNNAASVDGRGLLKMPSSSDLAGGQTDQASELEIQWSERMRFEGALSKAEFVGLVHAVQQPKNREQIAAATVGRTTPATAVLATRGENTDRRATPVSANRTTWTRSRVICHRLDVTFDRPIYFNNLGPGAAKNGSSQGRAQLRTAVCTPVPDDEVDRSAGAGRMVTFHQETFLGDATIDKSQRVTARQINVENDGREQQMVAAGPGEVRILQLGSKDQDAPTPSSPANRGKAPADEQEMKLTIVRFPAQMIARDKGKIFQEASFKDGARVVQVPSENLNLDVEEHNLPERGVFLACTQVLDVSSARTKPSQPAKQWMTAVGNAEFQTDKYHGFGTKIVYDTDKVVLKGSDGSPAKLYKKIHGQVDRQDYHTGQEIIYNRNGTITGSGSIGGSVNTGGGPK